MKYAAYSEYKTSNIGWIRDFPAHWKLTRLKYVANRAEVKVEADEYNPLPYIGLEQVEPWTGRLIGLDDDLVPTGISNRFEAGDTLFGKLRPYLAKACNVDFDGLCSSELLVLRGKTYNRDFLLYQLLSHGFINLVDSTTYGSKMPRASWDLIGICELPLPPLDEQQTIARFLDAKTAQIDALVAQKQQLIAKLKEKRSALIARTVTRGLPPEAAKAAGLEPNPEMKDSGVDWFGFVPIHWMVSQLKWAVMFQRGHDLPSEQREEGFVPLVTSAGISATHNIAAAKGPGIVTGRYGTIGQFHLVQDDYWPLNTTLYSIKLHGNSPEFLRYMLEHLSPLVLLHSVKSAVPGVDRNDLHPTMIALPPVIEQRAIAAYLDCETDQLDALAARVESAIARLTEYRQALITSAVTGKIDVRGLA
jgi:type I restriction enzyme S subunit